MTLTQLFRNQIEILAFNDRGVVMGDSILLEDLGSIKIGSVEEFFDANVRFNSYDEIGSIDFYFKDVDDITTITFDLLPEKLCSEIEERILTFNSDIGI